MEKINTKSEMKYIGMGSDFENFTILADGEYNEHEFKIISYGTHPCCYVKLNETDKYYGSPYDDIPLSCHGGITFAKMIDESDDKFEKGYWIGWDYAHYNDAYGTMIPGVEYTTAELIYDMKEAINELNSL